MPLPSPSTPRCVCPLACSPYPLGRRLNAPASGRRRGLRIRPLMGPGSSYCVQLGQVISTSRAEGDWAWRGTPKSKTTYPGLDSCALACGQWALGKRTESPLGLSQFQLPIPRPRATTLPSTCSMRRKFLPLGTATRQLSVGRAASPALGGSCGELRGQGP